MIAYVYFLQMTDVSLFTAKMDTFIRSIPSHYFMLEITKTCGHSELIIVPKNSTLLGVYQQISLLFAATILQLYITIDNGQIQLPLTENILLKDFFIHHRLSPIYNVSCPVVYRVILDDGHQH